MNTTSFFKTFLFTFLLATVLNILISPSWGSDEESDFGGWKEVKYKKRSGSKSGAPKGSSLKTNVTSVADITKKAQKLTLGGGVKQDKPEKKPLPPKTKSLSPKKKVQPPRPTTLIRAASDDSPLVYYTRKLEINGFVIDLNRLSTTTNVDYVWNASLNDGGKTHLLAQGVCRRDNGISYFPFTTTESFLNVLGISLPKKMVWVSLNSNVPSDNQYFIRNPQMNYQGGHAEPQFISDLQAAFTQNSDAVVKYFIPSNNHRDIYMCGLELFGTYDMCDPFKAGYNNVYDCVGQLINFRNRHQDGPSSISDAIRNKLGGKFKGAANENAFIVIYHSKKPYQGVHRYKAKEEDNLYPLQFTYSNCRFRPDNPDDFDTNSQLSQHKKLSVEKDVLYGYIHQLGDKTADYIPNNGFSFP